MAKRSKKAKPTQLSAADKKKLKQILVKVRKIGAEKKAAEPAVSKQSAVALAAAARAIALEYVTAAKNNFRVQSNPPPYRADGSNPAIESAFARFNAAVTAMNEFIRANPSQKNAVVAFIKSQGTI